MDTIGNTKKISDYLHLYLGCECFNHLRLLGVEGNAAYVSHPATGRMVKDINYLKPILRPLSDMTEEEKNIIGFNAYGILKSRKGDLIVPPTENGFVWAATQTLYLISQGFDLFGLIESGLAIDKTKIK